LSDIIKQQMKAVAAWALVVVNVLVIVNELWVFCDVEAKILNGILTAALLLINYLFYGFNRACPNC